MQGRFNRLRLWPDVGSSIMLRMDKDLKNLLRPQIEELVKGLGGRPYWAKYLFSFIHTKGALSIEAVTTLPKAFRQQLADAGFFVSSLATTETLRDPDGTVKLVFSTPQGTRLESVLLEDDGRYTLCISSQAGCKMGCRFCATGQLGFQADLSAAQIVDQVYQVAATGADIANVVYMGMGEPFDNYDQVLRSARMLNDPEGRNIGQRRITISTCGLPSAIEKLAGEGLQVRLAISLHAPDDEVRKDLMPIAARFSIAEILQAVENYQRVTRRRVTIEYCMIQGVNDQADQARDLLEILKGIDANVNLIEFNPFPGSPFDSSAKPRMQRFAQILRDGGLETSIRFKRGRQIKAACGQLGADQL
jgi:23S rRNA (adenine2503-C2)-methyltransferase